ncbi:terminase large subunit [Turicibacter sanguinis]|uniref:Terminase large subunit n=1 Tax=Turicibacter sanguinis TaxID=154288 RepID=A0A9X4XE03_9FIRM|nr:terminase large subunit [uncultured Turicibacter sp.]MTK20837.1 terminase large subunit [Turicibacter sanguinis]MTK72067.1 terminase large subunit [Turicibacter sanguinis]
MIKYDLDYNPIRLYYDEIILKKVTVSVKVKRVYQKLVHDLDDEMSEWEYDPKRANHAIEFVENFCKHSKGKMGGKPFIMELWQRAMTAALFGFVHKIDGVRKYREFVLIVARKNGKSAWASAIALYMQMADGEPGPECVSAATKKDQAKIVWSEAKRMVKKSPVLSKRMRCLVAEIVSDFNDGVFKPLSSDSNTLDGLNVHCSVIDELHAIEDKNLYDVIVDGMTAREQPISIITTTAGTVREGIFDIKYDECERIINGYDSGEYVDERVLPIIYELDHRKEWTDPNCWQKANPGLGTIKNVNQLKAKVEKAKANPLLVKNLLCKDFNIRETSNEAWLTFEQINNTTKYDLTLLKPRYGIGGADLSTTTDLTNATVIFMLPGDSNIYVKQMYWLPEDLLEQRTKEDKIPYDIWCDLGLLRTTPGNKVHYKFVTEWFLEIQNEYDIYLPWIGYDSWSATYWVEEMKNNFGKECMEPVIQGKKTLSGPMKSLGADLSSKKIIYDNHPILKWCLTNTSVEVDKNNNIQPAKGNSSRRRIDGTAGLLNAYVTLERHYDEYMNMI